MTHIDYHASGLSVPESLKAYVSDKLARLEKYTKTIDYAYVTLKRGKHHRHGQVSFAQIQLRTALGTVEAEAAGSDFQTAIDLIQEKLEQQLRHRRGP